ncbi:hypothetical protein CTAYLR_009783 [Chrysophaeum taylorii]|uniref:Sugar phosphate transporter domain-containing protein n=1 Tax=Chrysophaeum taylorii TaxID=2483200 RepID=A0AAD7XMJ3_9STRA|nr:hypothetical protein CTAYLR_009783 [Chrysophaeum taylorii]
MSTSSPSSSTKYAQVEDEEGLDVKEKNNIAWVLFCFVCYCVSGPATIFLNQHVLMGINFPFPAALSLLGVTTSTVVSSALLAAGVAPASHLADVTPRFYLVRVAPIGFALAGTLATGNSAYLHLSIAYVQILKALSPVILLSLLWATRIEKPRGLLAIAVAIIVSGMIAAAKGELRVTWLGLGLMFASEFCDSVKAINMQILLSDHKFDSMESLAVFGPAAVFGLALVSLLTEDYHRAATVVAQQPLLFILASVSGLGVNLATNMFIKATSALTLRVTSLARNVVIVLLAATFRRDSRVTTLEFAGYLFSLGGVALYNYARMHPEDSVAHLADTLARQLQLQLQRTKQRCGLRR